MKSIIDILSEASGLKYDFNLSPHYKLTSKRNFLFINFRQARISFIDIDDIKEVENWAQEFGSPTHIMKHLNNIRQLKVGDHTTFDNATYYVRIK